MRRLLRKWEWDRGKREGERGEEKESTGWQKICGKNKNVRRAMYQVTVCAGPAQCNMFYDFTALQCWRRRNDIYGCPRDYNILFLRAAPRTRIRFS